MEAQEQFRNDLHYIRTELREERPFPQQHFKFLYAATCPSSKNAGNRLEQLSQGMLMGVALTVTEPDGWNSDIQGEYTTSQSLIDLGHQVADYCEALEHLFHARIT